MSRKNSLLVSSRVSLTQIMAIITQTRHGLQKFSFPLPGLKPHHMRVCDRFFTKSALSEYRVYIPDNG